MSRKSESKSVFLPLKAEKSDIKMDKSVERVDSRVTTKFSIESHGNLAKKNCIDSNGEIVAVECSKTFQSAQLEESPQIDSKQVTTSIDAIENEGVVVNVVDSLDLDIASNVYDDKSGCSIAGNSGNSNLNKQQECHL